MQKSKRKQREGFNEINITPLTDIFLVLLIIMMVIAPLLDKQGLSLVIPNFKEQTKQEKENKIITIKVSSNGDYTMDDKKIALDDMYYSLMGAIKVKKDGLMIQADADSTHGAVVKVMDIARNIGIKNISVSEN